MGAVFLSEDEQVARIHYQNFWGRAKRRYTKISNIVPLEEVKSKRDPLWMSFYNSKERYRMHVKGSKINRQRFITVFGDPRIFK